MVAMAEPGVAIGDVSSVIKKALADGNIFDNEDDITHAPVALFYDVRASLAVCVCVASCVACCATVCSAQLVTRVRKRRLAPLPFPPSLLHFIHDGILYLYFRSRSSYVAGWVIFY